MIRGAAQRATFEKGRLDGLVRHECFRRPRDLVDLRRQLLDERQRSLAASLAARTAAVRGRLQNLQTSLLCCDPSHALALARKRVDHCQVRLSGAAAASVERVAARLTNLESTLSAISPVATLARGYTITTRKKTGDIVRSSSDLKSGDAIVTRFTDGEIESTVRDGKQMRLFET
jgi:exodeoxyribonuclease VII large subunit